MNFKYLILVLLVSLLFRLIILSSTSLTFFSDDAIYAALAKNLINGDLKNFFHPTWFPLFPFVSAAVFLILQNWETSLRIVSIISGVLLLIPLFILISKTISNFHAVLLTLIFTFFLPVIDVSLMPLSDSLFTTLIISSLITTSLAIYLNKERLLLLAAFLFGLSYLARPEGSMLFFLSIIYLSVIITIKFVFHKISCKSFFIIPLMIIIFLVTISPYIIAVRTLLGEWTMSAKFSAQIQQGHAFALRGNNTTWAQEITSIQNPNYQSIYFRNGFNYLLDHEYSLRHWFNEKVLKWNLVFLRIFPEWSIIFMIFGLISILRKKYFLSSLYLIFVMSIAIPMTIFSTAVPEIRYLLWTVPLFFIFYYLGFDFIIKIILYIIKVVTKTKFFSKYYQLTAFIPFGFSIFFPAININVITDPISNYSIKFTKLHYRPQFIEAAKFIQTQNNSQPVKIMMKHEMVEFYGGGETIYLPEVSYNNLLQFMKDNKVNYLIAWEEEIRLDKNLAFLVDTTVPHPGLKLIYKSLTPEGNLIIYTLAKY